MTSLVDRDGAFLCLCHHLGLLLQSSDDTVYGIEEILLLHCLRIMARSNQGCFITYIGDIGTRESWCLTGEEVDIHAVVCLHRLQMHLEHFLTLIKVRQIHMNLAIKTSCTQQGRVEHICTVCGCEDNHTRVRAKAVHLCQQGIQRVLALVIASHRRILRTSTAHSIDLVDEDDTRTLGLRLLEEVANTRGTHAHEHLDEIRT